MVQLIQFGFLTGDADAKKPLADAAFMAQIGAKLISEHPYSYSEYELRNAETGTRFTFEWYRILDDGGGGYSFWQLLKWDN